MLGKSLIVAVIVTVLLTAFVTPAVAALPSAGDATHTQAVTWSAPGGGLFAFPLSRFQPNGDCESGGNGSCPNPG